MAKKSTLLLVVSIVMIVLAAISTITLLLTLTGGALLSGYGAVTVGTFVILVSVLGLLTSVLALVAGILGCSGKRAGAIYGLGVALCVLAVLGVVLNIISGFVTWQSFVGLAMYILYLVGAIQNKKLRGM